MKKYFFNVTVFMLLVGVSVFAQDANNLNILKPVLKDADLVISIADISENASFYPVEIGGTRMEVIAVKAADGTVRTAFNTCQVCYGSGRGFYKQVGTTLQCQNCGNRFRMSQVEIQSGGCNPLPIFKENKTVTETTITISKEYLAKAKNIFAKWRRS
ncbi:MAG: hypothetical protein Ta2B_06320 [Termitinemataceae bacterium]|nr:MAG: hypothetical protein Ta2B_06320 [Termitinemataceae bacterium]